MKRKIKIYSRHTLLAVFVILFTFISFGQYGEKGEDYKNKREKIQAQKVAFITTKLDLTPEEAGKFWPIYNEFEEAMEKSREMFKEGYRLEKMNIEDISDEEALKIADDQIIMAQKHLDLKKEYHAKFKSVLPPKKVLMLYRAEREFQRVLLDKIRSQGPVKKHR